MLAIGSVGLNRARRQERGGEPALAVKFAFGLSDGLRLRAALDRLGSVLGTPGLAENRGDGGFRQALQELPLRAPP